MREVLLLRLVKAVVSMLSQVIYPNRRIKVYGWSAFLCHRLFIPGPRRERISVSTSYSISGRLALQDPNDLYLQHEMPPKMGVHDPGQPT